MSDHVHILADVEYRKRIKQMQRHPPMADSFQFFPKLAVELQLMIWEYTWPAPRVIEAALFDNPDADEDTEDPAEQTGEPAEIVNFRLAGSLAIMLRQDLGARITEEPAVEKCPSPVALRVCRLSRMHTLHRYRLMKSLAKPFYYHPQRDVIFFSIDVADDYPIHMPFLERHHGTELNLIETALVLDDEWPVSVAERESMRHRIPYTLDCMSHLGGLKKIQIFGRGLRSDGEVPESEEQAVYHGPQALATRLRLNFSAIVGNEKCTATSIEVIDIDGNLY